MVLPISTSTIEEMAIIEKHLKEYDEEGYQTLKEWIITIIKLREEDGDEIPSDFRNFFIE